MHSSEHRDLSRRSFLQYGVACMARPWIPSCQAISAQERLRSMPRIPIGLQLYSVRKECAIDLFGTIAAIAEIGYQGVEFSGFYDLDAAEWQEMLASNGLACCGAHVELAGLLGESLRGTIQFHRTLGNRFLIVPSLPRERILTHQAWQETARLFDTLSDELRPFGIRVGYHNHTSEFRVMDEDSPWDTFFAGTYPEVVMQLDIGNALAGGVDPIALLKRYPGRAATVHIKEYSKNNPRALIGEGDVNWEAVFELLSNGGTEWGIVEYEYAGTPSLDSAARCLDYLRRMGW
jgi:sugar phosphate isomerase/epimerase